MGDVPVTGSGPSERTYHVLVDESGEPLVWMPSEPVDDASRDLTSDATGADDHRRQHEPRAVLAAVDPRHTVIQHVRATLVATQPDEVAAELREAVRRHLAASSD